MSDHDNTINFPAPPPSPVGPNRRSFFDNDDILTDFLEHSLIVPDLILPDRVFPRQVPIQSPPIIDFESLKYSENDSIMEIIRDSISRTGILQVVNHGIGRGVRKEALGVSGGVFELGAEEKRKVKREIGENEFGFEEPSDCGGDTSEEFVWGKDERLRFNMKRVWPIGYSNFSEKIESIFPKLEKIARGIFLALEKHCIITPQFENRINLKEKNPGMCYIQKQCPNLGGDGWENSIKYDMIKMLIRGSDYYSHALALHLIDECSEFHVYSKKGWVSFVPDEDALVVTVGDQIQTWSKGEYKNVVGRPICKGENRAFISMAFLYSPTASNQTSFEKTISIGQQVIIVILFTFVYNFWAYLYKR